MAAGICLLDTANPCIVCENWPVNTWNKLRKALADARTKASQRGKPYWTSAFPQIEAWITRRTASIATSQPGSEFSSLADSDTCSSAQQNIGTEGSIVGDLKVQESIEVNAKMADLTRAPLAHQVMPMAHLKTTEMPTVHLDTIEAPRAHFEVPTAHIEAQSANGTNSTNGAH